MGSKLSIGLDFGTAEARAMLVDMRGKVVASAAFSYPHGVMTKALPDGTALDAGFALQHPQDYLDALDTLIPALFTGDASSSDVIGIGVDFTQCTMMPVNKDGLPLCFLQEFQSDPYAYVKLWKHHAAQLQAQRLTETALRRKEQLLCFCGGTVYAESMFPKILETFEKSPAVYCAAFRFIELADWIPHVLTGSWKGSRSIAGCAALWNPETGYPSSAFLEETAEGFGQAANQKLPKDLVPVGTEVGKVSAEMAVRLGIPVGIPVAAGLGDCQSAFVGAGLNEPGVMLSVMGTSSCDMLVSKKKYTPSGVYGVSYDSILPSLFGYEAGQANMGDLFRWFAENWVPPAYYKEAAAKGINIFDHLNGLAVQMKPGQTGLLALDWWSGNRSILLDTNLSGLLLGMTMETRCEQVYRALAEALCFGKRRIVEHLRESGIAVERLCATGSVAVKNPFFMQLLADILSMPVEISGTDNGSCLGSAVYGALAAGKERGGYGNAADAVRQMGGKIQKIYLPDAVSHMRYEPLYQEYRTLHDYFGQTNPVMKHLKTVLEGGGQ